LLDPQRGRQISRGAAELFPELFDVVGRHAAMDTIFRNRAVAWPMGGRACKPGAGPR
jgi:hypothetical protein